MKTPLPAHLLSLIKTRTPIQPHVHLLHGFYHGAAPSPETGNYSPVRLSSFPDQIFHDNPTVGFSEKVLPGGIPFAAGGHMYFALSLQGRPQVSNAGTVLFNWAGAEHPVKKNQTPTLMKHAF